MSLNKELPPVMPKFRTEDLQRPVDLLSKDGDPRKTAYVLSLATRHREFWNKRISNNGTIYEPSVMRMWQAEGLMEHTAVPSEKIHDEIRSGKTVKPRKDFTGYETRTHMAGEHMITVMAGVDALSGMLQEKHQLDAVGAEDVMLATATHDLNKDIEFQLTRMTLKDENAGYGQKGYDLAGEISKQKLRIAGVPDNIVVIHQAVGHASCPEIESDLQSSENGDLPKQVLMKLILHYVDDVVTNPNGIDPTITVDENGERVNALDRRCKQNEDNQNYKKYNEAWKEDPRNKTGETAFVMQRRVGHMVENKLASLLGVEDPLTLPQVINERVQKNIQDTYDRVNRRNSI